MAINESEVEKIAELAHLEISAAERRSLAAQLSAVVEYVEQLNEVDTSSVEPATGGLTVEGERTRSDREDATRPSLGQRAALEQAPDPAHGHFRVPKVLANAHEAENS